MLQTDQDWQNALIAWLHDPPDKAGDIRGHERRARLYLKAALGRDIDPSEIKGEHDQIASAVERMPLPRFNADRAVPFQPGKEAHFVHPLSGAWYSVESALLPDPEKVEEAITNIVSGLPTDQTRFLALWRLLPDVLPGMKRLPADTRVPDHSILQHMDTSAAYWCAKPGQTALLSFKLSPVQSFIEASRKTQDLLSGSYILSWLVFHAMKPVLTQLSPTAFIYPSLRGAPLVDLFLRNDCGLAEKIKKPCDELLTTPSLPNRFLALVPSSDGERLARSCEQACQDTWTDLASDVRKYLKKHWDSLATDWDRLWEKQISSFFSARCVWIRMAECEFQKAKALFQSYQHTRWFQELDQIAALQDSIPAQDRYHFEPALPGAWQIGLTYSAALMSAATEVRHIPNYRPEGDVPLKCSLLGTYEQIGPATLADSNGFWAEAQALREGKLKDDNERLCAISLVKRFAFEASLCRALGLGSRPRFPDTLEIARSAPDNSNEKTGSPVYYYAALMFDGDELGKWLDGRKSPSLDAIYHPILREYFEKLPAGGGLKARRPVGPALHAAISEALANFSLHIAPKIVVKHGGVLVYSGGDDVLALLPVASVLECALELRRAYSGCKDWNNGAVPGFYKLEDGTELLTMGPKATASAGVAVAHYKEDMRLVLEAARRAEKLAKNAGRDRLGISIMRRSGEHTTEPCGWDAVHEIQHLVELNLKGASDRWTYQLRGELEILESFADKSAHEREIRRLLDRSEGEIKLCFGNVQKLWEILHQPTKVDREPEKFKENPLKTFTILCQSASFLARGRDDR
jgi:CRISPR-associated protein Cmr2